MAMVNGTLEVTRGRKLVQKEGRIMTRNHALKVTTFVLGGLVLALAYVLAVGFLVVRATGLRDGAVLDFNNTLTKITEPHVPYLHMASMALIGSLVLFLLFFATRRQPLQVRLGMAGGFSVGTAALLVYSFVGIEVPSGWVSIVDPALAGWKGWLYKAGSDSSVHLVLVLALAWMLIQVLQKSNAPRLIAANSVP